MTSESRTLQTERELYSLALALGAERIQCVGSYRIPSSVKRITISKKLISQTRQEIKKGQDPLGETFCLLRNSEERRKKGATYTPEQIVESMTGWAKAYGSPERVVDLGSGSGRFILAAAKAFPAAQLIAVDIDPLAVTITRANLEVNKYGSRARVVLGDYRYINLGGINGETLFIGNPPYVRHHLISDGDKAWLSETALSFKLKASKLSGLHVHFFLATARYAKPGDYGIIITAAEWLDVNYGDLVRRLFCGPLGGVGLHIIEPTALPFPDAATTAAISCFEVGTKNENVRVSRIGDLEMLGDFSEGETIARSDLASMSRWSSVTRRKLDRPEGYIELGEICRVHRGQVTGANDFWMAEENYRELPEDVLFPTVTKALELYRAGPVLSDSNRLRKVIDLPEDLDVLDAGVKKIVNKLLRRARVLGIHKGYIARHRKAWWSVGLYEPAPILATYMARRAPGFVRNIAAARHINIAHGLYPRVELTSQQLERLTMFLSKNVSLIDGRVYAGGLTKFEPKEMERLLIPALETL